MIIKPTPEQNDKRILNDSEELLNGIDTWQMTKSAHPKLHAA